MSDAALETMRDLVQEDVGNRGLRTDPVANLVTACAGDFVAACRDIAGTTEPALAVVTGFFIPHAEPPAAETDGPLGAVFLARALVPLGIKVVLASDAFCVPALTAGLAFSGMRKAVSVVTLPSVEEAGNVSQTEYWERFRSRTGALTHLIAVERVGPSHTAESLRTQPGCTEDHVEQFQAEVAAEHHDRCHTMRGRDITATVSPAQRLFEVAPRLDPPLRTIGIGDGGNEIGMGKVPWDVIRRNIPNGGVVACRVPTDHLIVAGISNWGTYALAAGVRLLRGVEADPALFDPDFERQLLCVMVEQGPLVDGVAGKPALSVDGLEFDRYAEPLRRLAAIR